MKIPTEKLQIPRVKITTLILCAICGYAAYEAGHKVGSLEAQADVQVLQQVGYVNKAKSVPIAEFTDVPYNETAEYKQLKQHMKGKL